MNVKRIISVFVLVLFSGVVIAQSVPELINYQGRLTDDTGQPLDGVTVDLTFSFYGVESGGSVMLSVLQEDVLVTKGIYHVLIGSDTVTPGTENTLADVFQKHTNVWMGVKVNTDSEMTPRSRIASAAYAIGIDMTIVGEFVGAQDWDGDGFMKAPMGGNTIDCNDAEATVYPGAAELCDGIDNQCPGDSGYGTIDEGCGGGYSHTILIDGVNDFITGDEDFTTSTGGYTGYVSWDASYLYIGMNGADIGSNDPLRWLLIYLGGSAGTTSGLIYNTQQPNLPFLARYHVCWRADNSYTNAMEWTGNWTDLGWDFTGDVSRSGNYLEMRIPLADIGSPTSINLHICMINEAGGIEWTSAAVPYSSFSDGYNPNYSKYYSFDFTLSAKPNSYSPLP
jgi:hypothetical protein